MINEIFNDDCFNIFPDIKDVNIDIVLVDLPYGEIANSWDKRIDLKLMWENLKRICKPKTTYIFFATLRFAVELINSNPKWYRHDLVYVKNNSVGFLQCKKLPLRQHELILIFQNKNTGKKTYNPQMVPGKPYIHRGSKPRKDEPIYDNHTTRTPYINATGDRYPTSILTGFKPDKEKLHSCQKPVSLCEWLLKSYSNENDIVLDFCMGSASSMIACINLNRNYIGIEMDTTTFDKASQRIAQRIATKTGQKQTK